MSKMNLAQPVIYVYVMTWIRKLSNPAALCVATRINFHFFEKHNENIPYFKPHRAQIHTRHPLHPLQAWYDVIRCDNFDKVYRSSVGVVTDPNRRHR